MKNPSKKPHRFDHLSEAKLRREMEGIEKAEEQSRRLERLFFSMISVISESASNERSYG